MYFNLSYDCIPLSLSCELLQIIFHNRNWKGYIFQINSFWCFLGGYWFDECILINFCHKLELFILIYYIDLLLHVKDPQNRNYNWRFQLSLFSSVQLLSHVRLFATPWIAARQASLSITNSWSSIKLTSIESVIPSSHLILSPPLLLLPPIPPTIRIFSNESTLRVRWPFKSVVVP